MKITKKMLEEEVNRLRNRIVNLEAEINVMKLSQKGKMERVAREVANASNTLLYYKIIEVRNMSLD